MAKKIKKSVETLTHEEASRKNIPTAEYEAVLHEKDKSSVRVAYKRRNRDLDPQLVWRGKDEQDWSDLVVHAPPLYIQEKVHPKVLIDDLRCQTEKAHAESEEQGQGFMGDLFADFNGLPSEDAKTEFYQHDAHWSNRMILGDSLQVMASLAEREGLRGQVQCIYFDPPYGIKFNSNFQWSTTSRDVKDGNKGHITREPEMVKAFRDTWRDGIHSYLTYLRDRLTVARDLLTESGSVFLQIGDENLHRVRGLMEEIFGEENYVNTIIFKKKSSTTPTDAVNDYIVWFARNKEKLKIRQLYLPRKSPGEGTKMTALVWRDGRVRRKAEYEDNQVGYLLESGAEWARVDYPIVSQHPSKTRSGDYVYRKKPKTCGPNKQWRFDPELGLKRLERANRLFDGSGKSLGGIVYWNDWNQESFSNIWIDMHSENFPTYVVQTSTRVIERCLLMVSDPGDLVLDPTCGSGTTAYVAEQWGRRWITIDSSRVALALARSRIMGARFPYYLLADSQDGIDKEADVTRTAASSKPITNNIRHGFVYERVPRVGLKSIASNAEIDVIWENYQNKMESIVSSLKQELGKLWEEWEIPIDAGDSWSNKAKELHASWWEQRISRQKEIDASIAAKADFEYLYDKPYEDNKRVRVAGPFTVESLSPHRALTVGIDDELIDPTDLEAEFEDEQDFVQIILENLKTAGVQQANKEDKIDFISLAPWPGDLVCAEGKYIDENETEKRAAIFIGPEFGTVSRPDLVQAAREAADAGFDVLIACAFNYDAHSTEFEKLGRVPVLKARMNADLHMADDLKNTGKGNLFVIFGEPDIDVLEAEDDKIQVKINGVDVFHPNTGEVRSDGAEGIACWFIDTDYNEESFFVRQAYFLGANDPYKSLKTTLKAEINQEAWATLNSDISRPFDKPKSGRIAVKVINHLGDEVMKVYRV
ncbi:MAG: site-specific DNA-methyltransferase [Candidatus Thiodiazotropha sp. (ex Lucina pensylvanica)]|nr:site-specific DNA-methyltransferase [Candidatus Thiodiazotropha sp. (ex Lucina pensylvanica)]